MTVWDQSKCCRFKWLWYDATTFAPYTEETSYENSLLVQQTGGLALSSLMHVMKSLTPNAKGIFLLLAKYQMENKDNANYMGTCFYTTRTAYSYCFVCPSIRMNKSRHVYLIIVTAFVCMSASQLLVQTGVTFFSVSSWLDIYRMLQVTDIRLLANLNVPANIISCFIRSTILDKLKHQGAHAEIKVFG